MEIENGFTEWPLSRERVEDDCGIAEELGTLTETHPDRSSLIHGQSRRMVRCVLTAYSECEWD